MQKGRVLATERISLGGLLLDSTTVDFGKVDPSGATDLFIRGALIEQQEPQLTYPFLAHNRKMRGKIEAWQTRLRHHQLHDLDEATFQFYKNRLEGVSSVHDLNQRLKEHHDTTDRFLFAEEHDLVGDQEIAFDSAAFPERVRCGDADLEVRYVYAPGEDEDGVTIRVPFGLAPVMPQGALDWAVPGLRREQVMTLLRALPKTYRRQLMPLAAKADDVARHLNPREKSLRAALREFVAGRYGIQLPADVWQDEALPAHLKPRFELVGKHDLAVSAGRDLDRLTRELEQKEPAPVDEGICKRAADQWERFGLTEWRIGDLPERLELGDAGGVPLYAFPGMTVEQGDVGVRLFRQRDKAEADVEQGGWKFPVAYGMTPDQMRALGLYVSHPRSDSETDRDFPEPALFVANPKGEAQMIDISNAPWARPDLARIAGGIAFIQKNDYPIRGTIE